MLRNGLYIVATPIGNLKDISPRATEILAQAEIIACEDTRVSKKLFGLLGLPLQKKFMTYEDHSEEKLAQKFADLIEQGASVALISDAGSPLISDPGYKLVRACRQRGLYVTAVPGACAVITALQLSGLPTNRFMFAGFVPNKDKARRDLFEELKNIQTTLVFYETAPRLCKTLAQAERSFKGREIAVVRELTKLYEEAVCGDAQTLEQYFTDNEPRGEFVIVVEPPVENNEQVTDYREELAQRLAQTSLKTAVKEIADKYKRHRNEVYETALEIKGEQLS